MKHADLIARLEKLTGPDGEVDRAIMAEFYRWEQRHIGTTCWDDGHDTCCVGARHMDDVWVDATTYNWCTTAKDGYEFTGSLDRVVALKERLLPGFRIENLCEWDHEVLRARGPWMCDLVERGKDGLSGRKAKCSHAPTPAIALLIALLRALQESDPAKDEAQ